MDEIKKLLEGVFASVNEKGVEALKSTEGFDALEESQKQELTTMVEGVQAQLRESLHDELLAKITEQFDNMNDQHQVDIANLKEKADDYGQHLIEKGNEYGDWLKEQANDWCKEQLAEQEKQIAERLDEYLEIAFAEKLGESQEMLTAQKATAFDYVKEQLQFIMGEVGIPAESIEEGVDPRARLKDVEAELAESQKELATYKRREAIAEAAADHDLSIAQTEKLMKLAEHLEPDSERFESRIKYLVGVVNEGSTVSKGDDSLKEEYTPKEEDTKPENSRMKSYLAAARMTNNRF